MMVAASFMRVSRKPISGCGRHLDYDAARRVATSFEERENRIEIAVFQKGAAAKGP